jgi:hypothetical protein
MIQNKRISEFSSQTCFGDLNHDVSSSGAALTDFILAERRVERGEGHRFFDLVHYW